MNRSNRATCIVALIGLCLVASPATQARQGEVSYQFFYAALQPSGTWLESAELGYVWQPRVAAESNDWRPYTDGYWSQTDQGWTWVSYEDFGWATYHYGRWARLAETGWVWVPGFQWAPAWVAWRASPTLSGRPQTPPRPDPSAMGVELDEVVGWAPLPPATKFDFARGVSPQVDLIYGLGPELYNFVPVRNFGELVLRPWISRTTVNAGLMGSTWNCTSLAFRPDPGFILSGGPNFWVVRAVVQNPIAQLNLEAHFISAATPIGEVANRVDSDQFIVIAPNIVPPVGQTSGSVGLPVGSATQPPPVIGGSIPARAIDLGWSLIDMDQTTALREQIKREAAAGPTQPIFVPGMSKSINVIQISGPSVEVRKASVRKDKTPSPRADLPARTPQSRKSMSRAKTPLETSKSTHPSE